MHAEGSDFWLQIVFKNDKNASKFEGWDDFRLPHFNTNLNRNFQTEPALPRRRNSPHKFFIWPPIKETLAPSLTCDTEKHQWRGLTRAMWLGKRELLVLQTAGSRHHLSRCSPPFPTPSTQSQCPGAYFTLNSRTINKDHQLISCQI